jgi:hypothetical protein
MPSSSSLSLWKNHFLTNKNLSTSDIHLEKIKQASNHSTPFIKSFEEIAKNDGVAFLILDPSEIHLQLLHQGSVFGGNWNDPNRHAVAILGTNNNAKPVEIIQKSIKNIKEKSFPFEDIAGSLTDQDSFIALKNPRSEFLHKNIIAIPHFLIKSFVQLDSHDPFSVAKAFSLAIMDFDTNPLEVDPDSAAPRLNTIENRNDVLNETDEITESSDVPIESHEQMQLRTTKQPNSSPIQELQHIIQFCHLCAKGKIPPVLYSLSTTIEIDKWFESLPIFTHIEKPKSKN